MNIFEFMSGSPILTFVLACVAMTGFKTLAWVIGLPFRAMNIRKHGWPPAHLDADGDYKAHKVIEARAKALREARDA